MGWVRAAAPVAANPYAKGTAVSGHRDVYHGAVGVLGAVRQRLRDDVVGRRLDGFRKATIGATIEVDAEGRARDELLERRPQAVLGEPGRMDPEGDLAEVVECGCEAGRRVASVFPAGAGADGRSTSR
jgi:hypothetical protein